MANDSSENEQLVFSIHSDEGIEGTPKKEHKSIRQTMADEVKGTGGIVLGKKIKRPHQIEGEGEEGPHHASLNGVPGTINTASVIATDPPKMDFVVDAEWLAKHPDKAKQFEKDTENGITTVSVLAEHVWHAAQVKGGQKETPFEFAPELHKESKKDSEQFHFVPEDMTGKAGKDSIPRKNGESLHLSPELKEQLSEIISNAKKSGITSAVEHNDQPNSGVQHQGQQQLVDSKAVGR